MWCMASRKEGIPLIIHSWTQLGVSRIESGPDKWLKVGKLSSQCNQEKTTMATNMIPLVLLLLKQFASIQYEKLPRWCERKKTVFGFLRCGLSSLYLAMISRDYHSSTKWRFNGKKQTLFENRYVRMYVVAAFMIQQNKSKWTAGANFHPLSRWLLNLPKLNSSSIMDLILKF
jgi:hypothetical protein